MRFEELMNRLTGVNCPIFGISWNPSTPECTIARQIMSQLEAQGIVF